MAITEVSARFMRRAQVAQYEPAEAEAQIKGQVIEGESADAILVQCMQKARSVVLGALGLVKPQEPAPAVAQSASSDTGTVAQPAPAAPVEAKRPVGRPPKAKEPEAPAKPEGDGMDLPAFLDKTKKDDKPAVVTEPVFEIDETPPAKVISEAELQRECQKAAARLGSPDQVKKLMKDKYKVVRVADVNEREREAFIADLASLTK